ncbi:putative uncharacterized protein DDB_G0282133 [Gordionus sp. m RMFG-2023]|uniref:putative uncharacterized protein DDB_G0282133 n=1 Tax=Gordionus sp. m RMFG-2023 TaxID=3053472 RepID=UPI0031FD5897
MQITLIKKIRKSMRRENWEKYIIKFTDNLTVDEIDYLYKKQYEKISAHKKLYILKKLLEIQFDENNDFKNEILNLEKQEMRDLPIGRDILGYFYWFQQDIEEGIMIYKEGNDNQNWNVICKDRDELIVLIDHLKYEIEDDLPDNYNDLSEVMNKEITDCDDDENIKDNPIARLPDFKNICNFDTNIRNDQCLNENEYHSNSNGGLNESITNKIINDIKDDADHTIIVNNLSQNKSNQSKNEAYDHKTKSCLRNNTVTEEQISSRPPKRKANLKVISNCFQSINPDAHDEYNNQDESFKIDNGNLTEETTERTLRSAKKKVLLEVKKDNQMSLPKIPKTPKTINTCRKCSKSRPSPTLCCLTCSSFYHDSCIPPSYIIVNTIDSDWVCSLCEHRLLIEKLRKKLNLLDELIEKRKHVARKHERLRSAGIKISNILEYHDTLENDPMHKLNTTEELEALLSTRICRNRKPINYHFDDYDKLIERAIKEQNSFKDPLPHDMHTRSSHFSDSHEETNLKTPTFHVNLKPSLLNYLSPQLDSHNHQFSIQSTTNITEALTALNTTLSPSIVMSDSINILATTIEEITNLSTDLTKRGRGRPKKPKLLLTENYYERPVRHKKIPQRFSDLQILQNRLIKPANYENMDGESFISGSFQSDDNYDSKSSNSSEFEYAYGYKSRPKKHRKREIKESVYNGLLSSTLLLEPEPETTSKNQNKILINNYDANTIADGYYNNENKKTFGNNYDASTIADGYYNEGQNKTFFNNYDASTIADGYYNNRPKKKADKINIVSRHLTSESSNIASKSQPKSTDNSANKASIVTYSKAILNTPEQQKPTNRSPVKTPSVAYVKYSPSPNYQNNFFNTNNILLALNNSNKNHLLNLCNLTSSMHNQTDPSSQDSCIIQNDLNIHDINNRNNSVNNNQNSLQSNLNIQVIHNQNSLQNNLNTHGIHNQNSFLTNNIQTNFLNNLGNNFVSPCMTNLNLTELSLTDLTNISNTLSGINNINNIQNLNLSNLNTSLIPIYSRSLIPQANNCILYPVNPINLNLQRLQPLYLTHLSDEQQHQINNETITQNEMSNVCNSNNN